MVRPFQEGETPLTRAEIMIQGIRKLNEVILERHDKPFYELTEEDRFRFYKNLKMAKWKWSMSHLQCFSTCYDN